MKGIIFDMDGVIAITEDIHKKAFQFAFAGFGIDISRYDWNKDFAGKGHKYIVDTVFGKSPANNRFIDRWVYYYQLLAGQARPTPGVIKYINKNREIPMIVATGSARKSCQLVLSALRIDIPVVAMEDVPKPKPDPAIFIEAAKRINIPCEECWVFEDSIAGIRAGKNAGIKVIALTTTHTKEQISAEDPYMIIRDFYDLISDDYPQFEER